MDHCWKPARRAGTVGALPLRGCAGFDCVEEIDSKRPLGELAVSAGTLVEPIACPELLGGVTVLALTPPSEPAFRAVPDFAWNHRGLGSMAVWLPDGAR